MASDLKKMASCDDSNTKPATNIVIIDYQDRYQSFGWRGSIHIELDIQNGTITTKGWKGISSEPLSKDESEKYLKFFSDEKNLNDFFNPNLAYNTPVDTRFEHYTRYTLKIQWAGKNKEIQVGYPDIPFKHPFDW